MIAQDVDHVYPHAVAMLFELANGEDIAAYRCPYPSEGPICVRENGQSGVMKFRYANFVFSWRFGTSTVDISHGTINDSLMLWKDHPIIGEWSGKSLVAFGCSWAQARLDRL